MTIVLRTTISKNIFERLLLNLRTHLNFFEELSLEQEWISFPLTPKNFSPVTISILYTYIRPHSPVLYTYICPKTFLRHEELGTKCCYECLQYLKKKKKKKPPPPPTTTTISMWNVKFVLCFSVISVLATNKLRVNELLSFHCPFSDFSIYRPVSHSVRSVRIRSYSGPYFPAFGLNKCGKMRTRITPNSDTFYAVSEAIKRSYFRSLVSFLTRKELFIHLYI